MTDNTQPEALRLAESLERRTTSWTEKSFAAVELRRLHAENERLAALVEAQQPVPADASLRVALEQAARQALETLERASDAGYSMECDETITALREALKQVAPRKTEQWNPMNSSNAETALQMAAVIAHRDTEAAHQQAVPQADSQPAPAAESPEGARYAFNFFNAHGYYPSLVQAFDAGRASRTPADSVTAPVGDDFQPCPSCFGKGVDGDVDDYGHTIDVTCGECNGSGRAAPTTKQEQ